MIATAVDLLDRIARACNRAGRGLSLVAEAYDEAMELSHAVQRRYPHMGE